MAVLTRSQYLARYDGGCEKLFDIKKVRWRLGPFWKSLFFRGPLKLATAFRDNLGWPIVPLPLNFNYVCESSTSTDLCSDDAVCESEPDDSDAKDVETLWRPLFDLLARIGDDTLVATSMAEPNRGMLGWDEEQHAVEFPNDWFRLKGYCDWEWSAYDDAVVFDHTLGWGIHSWEEEPYSFFSAPRERVKVYLEAIGGVGVLRRDLDRFLADNEEGHGFTERFNAFINEPPFVTAGVPAGYAGPPPGWDPFA